MRKLIVAVSVAAALAVPASAAADIDDYLENPGRQQAFSVTACAGHGAFGIFRGEQGGWVPGEAQQGGIGDTTGPANSEIGRVCRNL